MPFFRGRGQDHEAAGLSASESDESDLEVCHAHHAPTPPTPTASERRLHLLIQI